MMININKNLAHSLSLSLSISLIKKILNLSNEAGQREIIIIGSLGNGQLFVFVVSSNNSLAEGDR